MTHRKETRVSRRVTLPALAAALVLAFPLASPAIAQTPFLDAYAGDSGVAGEADTGGRGDGDQRGAAQGGTGRSTTGTTTADALPFTGDNILLMAITGAAVLGLGLLARHLVLREHP